MEDVLAQLRQNRYRITQARREIINVLTFSPLEVKEIAECLARKRVKIDLATIYRTLERLVLLGLVSKTQFEDKTAKYELIDKQSHHHHLVCEKCGSVEDIPLNEERLMEQIKNQSEFMVFRHNLEFFGACKQCQ